MGLVWVWFGSGLSLIFDKKIQKGVRSVQLFLSCTRLIGVGLVKIRNGLAPKQLSNGFTLISDFHSHNTRGSSFNYAIKGPESASPATFVFTAIKHWNALPSTLKESGSLPKFREKTKEFLLSSY